MIEMNISTKEYFTPLIVLDLTQATTRGNSKKLKSNPQLSLGDNEEEEQQSSLYCIQRQTYKVLKYHIPHDVDIL